MKLKKLTAASAAAILAVSALAPSASAGQMLGQTDFEDGIGLPWHTCETAPGDCEFEVVNGKYNLEIINPGGSSRGGEDRWDVQLRHRGLSVYANKEYTISFELTASNSGQFYTKLGNYEGDVETWHNGNKNSGDFGQFWSLISVSAGQTYTMTCTFTPQVDVEICEWSFHLGGSGQYTPSDCFPAGTVISFDNMSLICNTDNLTDYKADATQAYFQDPYGLEDHSNADGYTPRNEIMVNQVGYYANHDKKATLVSDATSGQTFNICDASGKTVYTGTSTYVGADKDSGDTVHVLDFSDFTTEGTGYYITCGDKQSFDFNIGTWIYDGLLADSLNYFYQNRSAIAIQSQYITSGDSASLARAAGHTNDVAIIQTAWSNTAVLSGTSQNVTGGWYDAGDHGKYVVNGGISLWTLQNEYEMALVNGYADDVFGDGDLSIPESSNGYPDLLDEARWEMDWFQTMAVSSGTYAGMVYHKMHDESWTALALAPADDEKERIIKPPSTCATLNAAACAAQASRLWEGIDDTYAAKCLTFAKTCYTAAKANPALYAPLDQNIGGGPYGDTDATDEFYWAASELFATTGDTTYYTDMTGSAHHLKAYTSLNSGEDSGTIGCMNWGNTSLLGVMSLYLNKDVLSASDLSTLESNILAAADTFIGYEDEQGYGIPITQSTSNAETGYISITGYPWGSNSFVVCNAMLFCYANEIGGEEYFSAATEAMDYIFGRNPLDFSYVTGYGDRALTYPHHRWWSYQVDPSFPMAPSGVLSGGPNSTLQDPWVKGSGWEPGGRAPQLCYMDNIEAWSVNECTVNWNAPLAWLAGYLQENNATEDEPETDILWGDANCDGTVDVRDVAMAAKVASGAAVNISAQGLLNIDVKAGNGTNVQDVALIAKLAAGLLSQADCPK